MIHEHLSFAPEVEPGGELGSRVTDDRNLYYSQSSRSLLTSIQSCPANHHSTKAASGAVYSVAHMYPIHQSAKDYLVSDTAVDKIFQSEKRAVQRSIADRSAPLRSGKWRPAHARRRSRGIAVPSQISGFVFEASERLELENAEVGGTPGLRLRCLSG
jgi:hypothetical protein